MSEIDFDFATRDDCLQQMVPSDLRRIVKERDRLRDEKSDLVKALSYAFNYTCDDSDVTYDEVKWARQVLRNMKGEQE